MWLRKKNQMYFKSIKTISVCNWYNTETWIIDYAVAKHSIPSFQAGSHFLILLHSYSKSQGDI